MTRLSRSQWIEHLGAVAGQAAVPDAPLPLGPLEGPFRAAVEAAEAAPAAAPVGPGVTAETWLWAAITDAAVDVDAIIGPPSGGSLLEQGLFRTIEVWTEAELCALHALHRLARERGREDWRQRVADVRDWHLVHTQPDNATNRPWALHVFLLGGSPESQQYAETLLHNAMAFSGVPEPLSAWILIDAARELRIAG
ncbi:MAG: hypothetical protein ACYTJ0_17750 [Planctomycetota bacterium]|jgi:hypothetical protein